MPTRQDQLHSYQFMVQRVVAALVMHDTDPPQSPWRRHAGATLAGALVAALALGAVAAHAMLTGRGDPGWRDGGVVVVERESGARYVYRDGRLHPVVNHTSALLIIGSASTRTVHVPRAELADVPRGAPLGIPDAPDPLPDAERLVGPPWTLCSGLSDDGQGGVRPESVLFVGADPGGGAALTDEAVLLRHPDGSVHLVWRGRRHLVRDPSVVLPALGWSGRQPTPAAPAFLNALPAGADLARIPLDGRGTRSAAVPDARIGEVYVVEGQGGGRQHVVVVRDGLAVVTQVQADLIIGDPLTASLVGQVDVEPMSPGRYALLPKVGELLPAGELSPPAVTPTLVPAGDGVCAVFRDAEGMAEVRAAVAVPETEAPRTGSRTGGGAVLADRVVVPPGRGAVVEAMASQGAGAGTLSVVTDLGLRYEVPGPDVLATLGLGDAAPVRLPTSLVALLPAGRALDPVAARSPVSR